MVVGEVAVGTCDCPSRQDFVRQQCDSFAASSQVAGRNDDDAVDCWFDMMLLVVVNFFEV